MFHLVLADADGETYLYHSTNREMLQGFLDKSPRKHKYLVGSVEDLASIPPIVLRNLYLKAFPNDGARERLASWWRKPNSIRKVYNAMAKLSKEEQKLQKEQAKVQADATKDADAAAKKEQQEALKRAQEAEKAQKAAEKEAAKKAKEEEKAKKLAEKEAKKAEKAEAAAARAAARSRVPQNATITLLVKENPKKAGSAAHERFKLYKDGMTVEQFLKAGGTMGDVHWDLGHLLIKVDIPAPAPTPAQ